MSTWRKDRVFHSFLCGDKGGEEGEVFDDVLRLARKKRETVDAGLTLSSVMLDQNSPV